MKEKCGLTRKELFKAGGVALGGVAIALLKAQEVFSDDQEYLNGMPVVGGDEVWKRFYDYSSSEWQELKNNLPQTVSHEKYAPLIAPGSNFSLVVDETYDNRIAEAPFYEGICEIARLSQVMTMGRSWFREGVMDDPNSENGKGVFNPGFIAGVLGSWGKWYTDVIDFVYNNGFCVNNLQPCYYDQYTYYITEYTAMPHTQEQFLNAQQYKPECIIIGPRMSVDNDLGYEDVQAALNLGPFLIDIDMAVDAPTYDGNTIVLHKAVDKRFSLVKSLLLLGYEGDTVIGRDFCGPDYPVKGENGRVEIPREYFDWLAQEAHYNRMISLYYRDDRKRLFMPIIQY